MEPQPQNSGSGLMVWFVMAGVFVVAIAVTLFVGTDDETPIGSTVPDLGDIIQNDPNVPSASEAAPTFTLQTLDGQIFDLAQHIATDDRPVFLNLWASWCPPCRAEMPEINIAAARHPEVLFVGVAIKDDIEAAAAFAAEIGITYTIALDDGTAEEAYPVLGLPGSFFIDSDGTIAKSHFGVVTVDSIDQDIAELFGS